MGDMHAVNIRITGKVQGVFFRETARQVAEDLGLAGFVRNEPDGSVYAEAEGEKEQIKKFIAWCRKGPEHAKPDAVTSSRQPLSDFEKFEIADK